MCFDPSVGHDYLEDYQARLDFYHREEERLPFDIELLNKITAGGLRKKTLNVFMGGTGTGKSLVLGHISAATLMQGKNVLYISMEMSEDSIGERIDANLLDIPMGQLKKIDASMYESKMNRLIKKTAGKLIFKEYPTTSAHVGHFKILIDELKTKKNFYPDLIIIDYLNICASSRIKAGSGANSYTVVKSIAEEIRGLAMECNVPIISATQTTRCLALDTKVIKDNGESIDIKDVKVGDKIMSHSGFTEVKHVYPVDTQDVYEITTKSGKKIICSSKHIFPTVDGEKNIKSGLSIGDLLFVKK